MEPQLKKNLGNLSITNVVCISAIKFRALLNCVSFFIFPQLERLCSTVGPLAMLTSFIDYSKIAIHSSDFHVS